MNEHRITIFGHNQNDIPKKRQIPTYFLTLSNLFHLFWYFISVLIMMTTLFCTISKNCKQVFVFNRHFHSVNAIHISTVAIEWWIKSQAIAVLESFISKQITLSHDTSFHSHTKIITHTRICHPKTYRMNLENR